MSVAWIVLSDITMLGLGTAGRPILNVSLLKGLFWVTASGLLLHVIVFKQLERVRADEAAARCRLVEAEEIGGFGASEVYAGSLPEWSDGMFRLWGRAREDGVPDGAWLEERIDPRDLERARRGTAAAMRGEDSPPYDLHIRGGDGVARVLRITSRSEGEGGRVRSLILAQDVSELRALEHHAGESLRLLRSILESTDEGILVERSDTREILLWNDRFADLTHIPLETLERLDARVAFEAFHGALRESEEARLRMEKTSSDGGTASIAVLELSNGTVLEEYTVPVELELPGGARIWSYRDVTERFRARETLERRERQLAHAQKIAALGSFEWDLETQEARWSEELLGLSG
ncbi:MAG TPA: PAS-domain containing protein, partial [Thermoanaerobaculia bacterium]|nr:PAS-domain containing protein [Thermoanaerobaculia bacterium]